MQSCLHGFVYNICFDYRINRKSEHLVSELFPFIEPFL